MSSEGCQFLGKLRISTSWSSLKVCGFFLPIGRESKVLVRHHAADLEQQDRDRQVAPQDHKHPRLGHGQQIRHGENPARWRGHLQNLLADPNKIAPVTIHPAVPWQEIAAFMPPLAGREGGAARAVQFGILTACCATCHRQQDTGPGSKRSGSATSKNCSLNAFTIKHDSNLPLGSVHMGAGFKHLKTKKASSTLK